MAWRHYRDQGRRWPLYWFSINATLYCVTLLVLAFVLLEEEHWFVGLSTALTILSALYARRTLDANIGTVWRIALASVMLCWWAYMLMLVYWPDGDTKICYDRIRQTGFRGPMINLGPDPSCVGIPLSRPE